MPSESGSYYYQKTADWSLPTFVQDDNYEYLIIDESVRPLPFSQLWEDYAERDPGAQTNKTAIVDPYTPSKLEDAAKKENVKIGEFLLTTHGHHDHAGCVWNSWTEQIFEDGKLIFLECLSQRKRRSRQEVSSLVLTELEMPADQLRRR